MIHHAECLLVTPHVFPQQQMSMVLRTVKLLNQAKAEATDSERCAIKIETGTGTANEGGANSSSTSTIKRRSKRVPKGLCDQAMTDQDSSAAIMSKDMDNITARGVTRKRNAEYSSFKSRKKGTRTGSFEGRCKQLIDFKDEFGHCDVPRKFSADPSLGNWCRTMRGSYSKVQQGQTPHRNLTQDQIERLEEIGFKWKLGYQDRKTFEQRYHDLEVFKSKFGHCNVPFKYSVDLSLGNWCSGTRCAYDQIQRGQTPRSKLTQDQIERLDEIGFKWKCTDYGEIFEQRCCGLEAFKSEFGHCNVPCRYLANPLLGNWCSKQRCSYKKMQKGQTPKNNLTKDQIERLEGIGFKWKLE